MGLHLGGLAVLFFSLLTLVGCTDPGLCKRGELGCACTQDDQCDEGTCDANGMCVDDGSGGTSGTAGDSGSGATDAGGTGGTGGPDAGTDAGGTGGNTEICTDTCQYNDDGACDDGGPNSMYSLCDIGTDCTDCGPRTETPTCSNTCQFHGDGTCDDGGPDATYSLCPLGSDCTDCGDRAQSGMLCDDTCQYQGDGECDDGGPSAMYSACNLGTDCTDCGPREAPPATAPVACRPIMGTACAAAVTVEDACQWGCELWCQGRQQFCDLPCPANFCVPGIGAGYRVCALDSDGAGVTKAAADAFCQNMEGSACADFAGDTCTPNCAVTVCETTCRSSDGMIDWSVNGTCDDGGPGADYDACIWGTDCTDCGPRTGNAPACIEIGGCCGYQTKCCGGADGQAHCLGPDGDSHCRTDCTETGECDTGFLCTPITSDGVETGDFGCVPVE